MQIFKMAVADCPSFHQSLNEYELLRSYFDKGYTYKDTRDFIETEHGILLSEDQLRRKLWFRLLNTPWLYCSGSRMHFCKTIVPAVKLKK